MNYTVTDFGFGQGPHFVINPKTGSRFVYMTKAQAEKGALKRPGTKPAQVIRNGKPAGSWFLVLE